MSDSTASAPNGNANLEALKNNAANAANQAYNTVANGPVAENIKDQTAKTSNEFSNLAAARQTPSTPAATGQPLTHYHSFFSELLSWNNPRASAIAYASIVTLIFSIRYLDVFRWAFKLTWMVLGITVAAEVLGKTILNSGLASQVRPRKYYTVPRETLDSMIGDVNELVNFFVIEAQRILFAENVYASAAAAVTAFISYYLVKIVPYWGLSLIATTTLFFAPLVYKSNQEFIDEHLRQATEVVSAQTAQLREATQKTTAQYTEVTKQYMGDYTAKAQELIRGRSASPEARTKPAPAPVKKEYKDTDFPEAPKASFESKAPEVHTEDPVIKPNDPALKTADPLLS
ncbi:Reticulon-like protein [Coniochaeta hoffmannii]|uniref:Reticulon-like protein n=1 Tax=Coniochaeta hoffmannii TaxID=91930 RepID=A0AA38VMQ9_9PEZI|nr:Reticulon-like protein [Coniochaeta hoffmannii]